MKNLENYGVQELNAMEMNKVDGGYPIFRVLRLVIAAVAAAHEYSGCTGHSGTYVNKGGVVVANIQYN